MTGFLTLGPLAKGDRTKLLEEVNSVIRPKLFNINNKTASEREVEIVKECMGFRSLIMFSALTTKEIRKLWDDTNLGFM